MTFWQRFIGFRKDFGALTYDALRACVSTTSPLAGRFVALFAFVLLLGIPATVLVLGDSAFGDKFAFGASFGLWPVLLEASGWYARREDAARIAGLALPTATPTVDAPIFLILTLTSLSAEVIAFYALLSDAADPDPLAKGLLWGIALAGALDFARSAVASFLAGANGYPFYQ